MLRLGLATRFARGCEGVETRSIRIPLTRILTIPGREMTGHRNYREGSAFRIRGDLPVAAFVEKRIIFRLPRVAKGRGSFTVIAGTTGCVVSGCGGGSPRICNNDGAGP